MAERNSVNKKLSKIYYNPHNAGSFGGVSRLLTEARKSGIKLTIRDVRRFLDDQHSYSLHRPVRKAFVRNRTFVSGIDKQWQADLADMQAISTENGGVRFMLTVIDVFSKFAWVIPVKDKSAPAMVSGFEKLFKDASPRKPERLQTDKGKEFLCKPVQNLLAKEHVKHFTSNSDQKAAVVERFNRTIKTRIWTYFTAKRTRKYVDVLQNFVDAYNHSQHRSIGMAPADVRPEHETKIWRKLYGDGSGITKSKKPLERGQMVRISRWKGEFEKGYMPNWSAENFHISKAIKHPHTVYSLRDSSDEPVHGAFYRAEIQPIRTNKFFVEKVLRKRTLQGTREVFIKWKGWPSKFNSWIPERDVKKYS